MKSCECFQTKIPELQLAKSGLKSDENSRFNQVEYCLGLRRINGGWYISIKLLCLCFEACEGRKMADINMAHGYE